jgi:hypothetical protein
MAQQQADKTIADADARSRASDKEIAERRGRIEKELSEQQANAKIRAAKIIEDAEQRLAEAQDRTRKADDFERRVSEQVSATYAILGEARRHFTKVMSADGSEPKATEKPAPSPSPSPQPSPHPKPHQGNQAKAPVNGNK